MSETKTDVFPIYVPKNAADAMVGPNRTTDIMPKYKDIPEEFTRDSNKWVKFQQTWFFSGLKNLEITPKEGIDKQAALRHLNVIQRSWDTEHNHKQAAVAFLASQWFEDVKYEAAK